MPNWKVFARDASLNRIAQIDDYVTMKLSLNYNKVSSWELVLPFNSNSIDLFQFDNARGVAIYRDDEYVLGGPLRKTRRQKDSTKNQLTVSGPDDLTWLWDVLCYPPGPALTGDLYSATWDEFDTRSGDAETVIKDYVKANIGSGADPTRACPHLTIASNAHRGSSVVANARFDNLLDFCTALALQGGDWRLGFSDAMVFDIFSPQDLTATVVFSEEFGNVSKFDYTEEAPTADLVVAGGSGSGASRIWGFYEDSTARAKYGRIEYFKNQNASAVVADLDDAARGEVLAKQAREDMSMTAITTPLVQFGRDYLLGDLVTVVMDEIASTNPIRQIDISVDSSGEVISPVISPPTNFKGERMALLTELIDVRRRVRALEAGK